VSGAIDIGLLAPALLAGLLVLATHVPLGLQVLRRGIIFLDLALAQIAALGVIAAVGLGLEPHGIGVQLAAGAAALLGAGLLGYTERVLPKVQEAVIGSLFVLAATAAVLLLAGNPHGGEQLRDLLAGQILWVSYEQLLPVAILYGVLAAVWAGWRRRSSSLLFYVLFALAVTASVQMVGVYLVFASLIVPALATHRLPEKRRLPIAYGIGVAGYTLGIVVSALTDLPTGAVIVWTLALTGLIVAPLVTRAPKRH
jgi:zinc/manganese transport system permease protein